MRDQNVEVRTPGPAPTSPSVHMSPDDAAESPTPLDVGVDQPDEMAAPMQPQDGPATRTRARIRSELEPFLP